MNTARTRPIYLPALALLGGGIAAGVIGTTTLGANAQSTGTTAASTSTSTSSTSSAGTSTTKGDSNETPVTGAKAATLKANALKKVPGATVDSVTTEDPSDSSGAAYEVHITKADGSHATLLFNSKLAYVSTETGGGRGGHGGHGNDGGGRGGAGETTVTGSNAATLKAAALTHVPGATVNEVSTDSGDAAFEVHLTKADGTQVTVKFDKNLKYVSVESGRGK